MDYPGNTIRGSTLESERENLSPAEHTTCASPINNFCPEVCLALGPGIADTMAPVEQFTPGHNSRQLRSRRENEGLTIQLDPQRTSYEHLWE